MLSRLESYVLAFNSAWTYSRVCRLLVALTATGLASQPRLNQIQVIGSHNSYHIAPDHGVMSLIAAAGGRQAESLDYTHPPLAEQFSQLGIRHVELDAYADPKGGLYASPSARKILTGLKKDPGPDPNAHGELDKPGLKILHIPDVDFRSTAPTFVDALKQIRSWSQTNPRHVPIMILVELKDDAIPSLPTRPVRFDRQAIDTVDTEILSVFAKTEIITPDRIRGRFATLPDAIRAQGWPVLNEVRGLVIFALDNEGSVRDRYLEDHEGLKGRVMFASVEPHTQARLGSRSTTPSRISIVSSISSVRASWSARGLMRTRARPAREM